MRRHTFAEYIMHLFPSYNCLSVHMCLNINMFAKKYNVHLFGVLWCSATDVYLFVYRRSCSTQIVFFCSSTIRSLMTLMRSSVPAQASGSTLTYRHGMPSSSFSFARLIRTNSSSDSRRWGNFLCEQDTGRKQSCSGECGNVWVLQWLSVSLWSIDTRQASTSDNNTEHTVETTQLLS